MLSLFQMRGNQQIISVLSWLLYSLHLKKSKVTYLLSIFEESRKAYVQVSNCSPLPYQAETLYVRGPSLWAWRSKYGLFSNSIISKLIRLTKLKLSTSNLAFTYNKDDVLASVITFYYFEPLVQNPCEVEIGDIKQVLRFRG